MILHRLKTGWNVQTRRFTPQNQTAVTLRD
jgi:hypothetical protein